MVHNHLQEAQALFATARNESISRWQAYFVKSVNDTLHASVTTAPHLQLLNQIDDIWAQDFLEPGYTSMPGPDGPISLRVMLKSAQSTRIVGRQVFEQLRGPGLGAMQPKPAFGHEEINSGGNIETIPPYTSKSGVHYPQGRITMGKHHSQYPALSMLTFLQSQGVQNPLILETRWVILGHVDEVVQFLPSKSTLGFKIAIASTTAALNLLRRAQKSGHASVKLSSYDGSTIVEPGQFSFLPFEKHTLNLTIDRLFADKDLLNTSDNAQKYINQTMQTLQQEIELTDDDFLFIPILFNDFTTALPHTPDGLPDRLTPPIPGEQLVKLPYPESINGLVLSGHYLAPKPWGPVIDGRDILDDAIVKLYGSVGMEVGFIDDYMSHHVRGGEVHCGTNTFRAMNQPWWG